MARANVLEQNSGSYGKQYKKWDVEAVTADKTLDADDSGKLFVVNPAAETTLTLPSVGLIGWNCTVVLTEGIAATDGSMNNVVNIALGQGDNIGQVHEVDGTAGNFAVTGDDFFVFTAAATPGDRVELISDGTQWIIQAYVKDLSDSDFSANATTIA
tara:strand:- start:1090 stop:1560 length:471 start_codon:yes stop_codon:yes gene_type:complete